MAATQIEREPSAPPLVSEQDRDRAIRRFLTPPNPEDIPDSARRALVALHDQVIELGALIDATCPDSMNKSLALRHLEDSHIRAARAIYAELS